MVLTIKIRKRCGKKRTKVKVNVKEEEEEEEGKEEKIDVEIGVFWGMGTACLQTWRRSIVDGIGRAFICFNGYVGGWLRHAVCRWHGNPLGSRRKTRVRGVRALYNILSVIGRRTNNDTTLTSRTRAHLALLCSTGKSAPEFRSVLTPPLSRIHSSHPPALNIIHPPPTTHRHPTPLFAFRLSSLPVRWSPIFCHNFLW